MSTESVGSWSPSLRPQRLFRQDEHLARNAAEEKKPLCFVGEQEGNRSLDSPLKAKASPGPSRPAADGRDYPVKQCPCGGGLCVVLVSRTERNPGRHFYRCPMKSVSERCNFFQWCDMASPNQQHGFNSPANQTYNVRSPVKLNQQNGPSKAIYPICSCSAGRCSVLTMQHGENAGRKYYACAIKKGQGACNHFQWVDNCGKQPEIGNNNLVENKLENELSSPTLLPEELDIPNIDEVVNNYFCKKAFLETQETTKIDNHEEVEGMKVAMAYQILPDFSTVAKSPAVSPKRVHQPNLIVETSPIKRLNLNKGSPGAPSPGKCYRCGKEGHWMKKCTGCPASPCFKCGKVGHWKKDCIG
ncbi:uncharacterized protein [Typha latifolia]